MVIEQVNKKSNIESTDDLNANLDYKLTDIKILLKTIPAVIFARGAY